MANALCFKGGIAAITLGFSPKYQYSKYLPKSRKLLEFTTVSEEMQSYSPDFSDIDYRSVQTCIVDYQLLSEIRNPWLPFKTGLSKLTDLELKTQQLENVRSRD